MTPEGHIIITGSAGYAGSMVAQVFQEKGIPWKGWDLMRSRFSLQFDFCKAKPADFNGASTIIHLAGRSKVMEGSATDFFTINTQKVLEFATSAKKAGIQRFIFISSSGIYGNCGSNPCLEDRNPNPVTEYARSKFQAELNLKEIADDGFQVLILRPGSIFGFAPRIRKDVVSYHLMEMAHFNGKIKLKTDGQQYRSFIHSRDFARMIKTFVLEEQTGNFEVYNACHPNLSITIFKLAQLVQSMYPGSIIEIPDEPEPDKRDLKIDPSKFQSKFPDFNFEFSLMDGLKELKEHLHTIENPQDPNE